MLDVLNLSLNDAREKLKEIVNKKAIFKGLSGIDRDEIRAGFECLHKFR